MNSVDFYVALCAPLLLVICCYLMVRYHRASLASTQRAARSKATDPVVIR